MDNNKNDDTLNTDSPVVKGEMYGVYSSLKTHFSFFDGKILGGTDAYNLDEFYELAKGSTYLISEEENYTKGSLVSLNDFITDGTTTYNNLCDAMDSIETSGTLKLIGDGINSEVCTVKNNQSITVDLNGHKLTEPEGEAFGLRVMQALNDACAKWKDAENIDYSLYGTPLESTTYKFAKALQRRFGLIKGVTDRNYITNSYHIHVTEPIDAFKKLALESKFQKLSPGGAISYVEVPDMQNNIDAVLDVMAFIYENIMYAELNTKSDYCQECGFDGEIQIKEDDGKLIWECPHCGNRDQAKLNVARRTCGYIGTQFWNQGRTQEIQERVLHL